MLDCLNSLRNMDMLSILLRFACAMLCGGIIGIEREFRRRPSGFRTHILICLGAAITTMTGQYLAIRLGYDTDVSRLGAQVIAGVGFIGAGSIIVSKSSRVKGLTTAAGLWTAAIIGLCAGAGFYEAAIIATALVLLAELLFTRLEYLLIRHAREVNLYLEYEDTGCVDQIWSHLTAKRVKVNDVEFGKDRKQESICMYAVFSLRLNKKDGQDTLLEELQRISGVSNARCM